MATPESTPHAAPLLRHLYFPSAIYTVTRPDFLAAARAVFDDTIGAAGHIFNDARLAAFTHYVATTAWSILDGQGHDMTNQATYFTEMWGQQLGRHASMPEHVHPGAQIVGLYFLDVPAASSRLQVHDPRPGKVMVNMAEKQPAPPSMASSLISVAPEAGMLFFANAWLPHSLTRHDADAPLAFIHFNVGVRPVPAALAPVAGAAAAEVI